MQWHSSYSRRIGEGLQSLLESCVSLPILLGSLHRPSNSCNGIALPWKPCRSIARTCETRRDFQMSDATCVGELQNPCDPSNALYISYTIFCEAVAKNGGIVEKCWRQLSISQSYQASSKFIVINPESWSTSWNLLSKKTCHLTSIHTSDDALWISFAKRLWAFMWMHRRTTNPITFKLWSGATHANTLRQLGSKRVIFVKNVWNFIQVRKDAMALGEACLHCCLWKRVRPLHEHIAPFRPQSKMSATIAGCIEHGICLLVGH